MLKVWEESFEIIISSSGCVHLLGRVVEPSEVLAPHLRLWSFRVMQIL